MLSSLRKNDLTSLFKEVRVFKERLVHRILPAKNNTVVFEIITLLIQKHFKTVTITVVLRKNNSNDFQDGNWE